MQRWGTASPRPGQSLWHVTSESTCHKQQFQTDTCHPLRSFTSLPCFSITLATCQHGGLKHPVTMENCCCTPTVHQHSPRQLLCPHNRPRPGLVRCFLTRLAVSSHAFPPFRQTASVTREEKAAGHHLLPLGKQRTSARRTVSGCSQTQWYCWFTKPPIQLCWDSCVLNDGICFASNSRKIKAPEFANGSSSTSLQDRLSPGHQEACYPFLDSVTFGDTSLFWSSGEGGRKQFEPLRGWHGRQVCFETIH